MTGRTGGPDGVPQGLPDDPVTAERSSERGATGYGAQMHQGVMQPEQRRAARRGRRGGGEPTVVPEAEFRSYYGRPVLKAPVWEWKIAAYLFTGGLAAGSAVVAAGSDLTGREKLRRAGWLGTLGGLLASLYFLVSDLGRPERFHHMLRVAKPTSPMSVGTWILSAFGGPAGVAAVAELLPSRWQRTWPARLLRRLARPAGVAAAATAPALASYTAVLLSHTAVPGWNEARDELPFVFAGSAAASGGGLGMLCAPVEETGPARVFAAAGATVELAAASVMHRRLGIVGEAHQTGRAGKLRRASEALTVAGLVGTVLLAGRSRAGGAASGLALLAGSALQRFAVFEAGVASAKDPRYVVVPQRERLTAANNAK
jgi:formate-dependent nitrite reductase membrane component NrfD